MSVCGTADCCPTSRASRGRLANREDRTFRPHNFGADPWPVTVGHYVIDSFVAAISAEYFAMGEPCSEHPLVQSMPGMAEWCLEREPLAGSEPVERNREAVDADAAHGSSSSCRSRSDYMRIAVLGSRCNTGVPR